MTTRSEASQAASVLGQRGGEARAKALSPERRREIAVSAGLASGEARRLSLHISRLRRQSAFATVCSARNCSRTILSLSARLSR